MLSSMAVGTDQAGAVCHGVLVVTMPSGKTLEIKTTFDSGSEVDAVSKTVATELKDMGCPWGEAGGGIAVADGSEVTPFGELRLMLTAEPRRREGQKAKANEFAIPRPLTFVTDAKIIDGLTSDLIIGWPTLRGTGTHNTLAMWRGQYTRLSGSRRHHPYTHTQYLDLVLS